MDGFVEPRFLGNSAGSRRIASIVATSLRSLFSSQLLLVRYTHTQRQLSCDDNTQSYFKDFDPYYLSMKGSTHKKKKRQWRSLFLFLWGLIVCPLGHDTQLVRLCDCTHGTGGNKNKCAWCRDGAEEISAITRFNFRENASDLLRPCCMNHHELGPMHEWLSRQKSILFSV